MSRVNLGLVSSALSAALIGLAIVGCDTKPAAETSTPASTPPANSTPAPAANILGKYENTNEKITIELKADGKATMIDEGKSTEVTWEKDGADKLIIHGQDGMNLSLRINSDGNLADTMGMGSVFRKK